MLNAFLDADVFEAERLDFDSPHFVRVAELVAAGAVQVYLTDVVDEEVRAAIAARVKTAVELLRRSDVRRDLHILGLPRPDARAVTAEATAKFAELRSRLRAVILPTDDVPIKAVRERAAQARLDWATALNAIAVDRWCEEHRSAMLYVSGNPAAKTAVIPPLERHVESLAALIDAAVREQEPNRRLLAATRDVAGELGEELEDRLSQEIEHHHFFLDDVAGDVRQVTVTRVVILASHLFAVEGTTCTFELDADVEYEADVRYADPDRTTETVAERIRAWTHVTARVRMDVDVDDAGESTIEEVRLSDREPLAIRIDESQVVYPDEIE